MMEEKYGYVHIHSTDVCTHPSVPHPSGQKNVFFCPRQWRYKEGQSNQQLGNRTES
jgi:hypothetical protein